MRSELGPERSWQFAAEFRSVVPTALSFRFGKCPVNEAILDKTYAAPAAGMSLSCQRQLAGIRSTGLIAMPAVDSAAARLISAKS